MNLTSTLQVSGQAHVDGTSGLQVLPLQYEKALKEYQDGMDGMAWIDQTSTDREVLVLHQRHITKSGIKSMQYSTLWC